MTTFLVRIVLFAVFLTVGRVLIGPWLWQRRNKNQAALMRLRAHNPTTCAACRQLRNTPDFTEWEAEIR